MTRLDDYAERYRFIKMTRRDGILEMRFHTDDGPLTWGHWGGPHAEFGEAFSDVARDPENRVVIMTGTGDRFSGPKASPETFPWSTPESWDAIVRNGMRLSMALLEIEAIVISCINGPALRHAEIPLLADVVLAADTATIQDSAHFPNRTLPGDGMNLLMPLLMGYNRGRYFLLTGHEIGADEALELGLVNEVMPREALLPRAYELAEGFLGQNPLVLRYTRMMFTHQLKQLFQGSLGFGLALEGLAAVDETLRNGPPDG
jgi:enoyl-CoA hydratase/carnithine racemase